MSLLAVQSHSEWVAIKDPWCIGVLDCTTSQASASFGWVWDEVEEDGLGPTFYVPLAWDGTSRFLLSAVLPENGIAIEVSASEDVAQARRDLLRELGLTPEALLALSEGGVWFARWDLPTERWGATRYGDSTTVCVVVRAPACGRGRLPLLPRSGVAVSG